MQLLTTLTSFLKSRQKVLLKRRKVQLKNRPMSTKRLKEEQSAMNVSYEMKLVNIKQQLDRKKSQNHHINQIVEELFYPEVKMTNQQEVELRVKQLGAQGALFGQNWEEELKADDLTQEIQKASLPLDILSIHQQKWQEFTAEHYGKLMFRLGYYCNNRERIKSNTINNWERLVKKMQETEGKTKPNKCPYLFLEKEEIMRHEHWGSLMKEIHKKLTDIKDIKAFNDYLPVLFQLQRNFHSIPADIFTLVLTRNALANFQELTKSHISSLMKFLKFKNRVKYDPHIKITNPQEAQEANINHFARKLATEIINNPQHYSKDDFINIFIVINTTKKRMNILTQELLTKSENIMTSLLGELSFENVVTYTIIYAMFNTKPNLDFLEILKFDLYRKCQQCNNYHPILILMGHIKHRKLTFRNYREKGQGQEVIAMQGFDLFNKLAEAISKLMNQLKPQQIGMLLNSCFSNDLKQSVILEVVSTEFVKRGKDFSLQNLAKGFFKLTLLGHRSKILSKFVFDQFAKKYHQQVKRYKQEDNFLLPTQNNKQADGLNFKLIHLQECLIMMIWGLQHQLGQNLMNQVSLDTLLTLLPVKLESMDPLCIELACIINKNLQVFSLFPKIQWTFAPNYFPAGRLKQFYKPNFSKNDVELLMWEESKLISKFIENYNFATNMFLGERWSEVSVYSQEKYLDFCIESEKNNTIHSFFDKEVALPEAFLTKRREVMLRLKQAKSQKPQKFFKSTSRPLAKNQKFYDLLI